MTEVSEPETTKTGLPKRAGGQGLDKLPGFTPERPAHQLPDQAQLRKLAKRLKGESGKD